MALKSLPALAQAIAAVKKEAGDKPEFKELVSALSQVSEEVGESPAEEKSETDDDYSFEAAEKRHVARNADARAADKADKGDQPQGGESK